MRKFINKRTAVLGVLAALVAAGHALAVWTHSRAGSRSGTPGTTGTGAS